MVTEKFMAWLSKLFQKGAFFTLTLHVVDGKPKRWSVEKTYLEEDLK